MENKVFKQLIEANSKKLKFAKFKTSFFRESEDAQVFLIPRKSGYSNYYYLRLKVVLKPIEQDFDKNEFIKHDVADILLSLDSDNRELFDLENELSDPERTRKMEDFFSNAVDLWVNRMLSKKDIIDLHHNGNFFVLPYTMEKLGLT